MAQQKQKTQKTQKQKKSLKKQRGGASLPFSFFNPVASWGGASWGGASADTSLTTAQTGSLARTGIFQTGGGRTRKFKMRGGFSPSVMGPFLRNVEALAAPLSMYLGWKMFKGTKGRKSKTSKKH
jgi:hypothetical protein